MRVLAPASGCRRRGVLPSLYVGLALRVFFHLMADSVIPRTMLSHGKGEGDFPGGII